MPVMDFGYGGNERTEATEVKTDLDTGKEVNTDATGGAVDNIDKDNDVNNKDSKDNNNGGNTDSNKDDENKNDSGLTEGDVIEVGDDKYTVDKNGNLVDKDGNIFKEAKDVAEFIKGYEVETNEPDNINISDIINKIGVQITDEKGNNIEYDNTPEGIAAYVENVLDLKRTEYAQAGVQSLIEKYPIVSDFINYYVANGNSAVGFGEQPDRSKIVIDENNVSQQEAIIREAWKESNRPGDVETYIKYLKDTNNLLTTANAELEALKQKDTAIKEAYQKQAKEQFEAEQKQQEEYWNEVKNIIDSKSIAGYKIPDTIIINRDGKKLSATPNDFFNYLYQVDENGISRYEHDLMNKDARKRNEDNILAAYLVFTGNGYSSLVNMAIANEKAQRLKIKHVENTNRTIKITKAEKKNNNLNIADVIAESI